MLYWVLTLIFTSKKVNPEDVPMSFASRTPKSVLTTVTDLNISVFKVVLPLSILAVQIMPTCCPCPPITKYSLPLTP